MLMFQELLTRQFIGPCAAGFIRRVATLPRGRNGDPRQVSSNIRRTTARRTSVDMLHAHHSSTRTLGAVNPVCLVAVLDELARIPECLHHIMDVTLRRLPVHVPHELVMHRQNPDRPHLLEHPSVAPCNMWPSPPSMSAVITSGSGNTPRSRSSVVTGSVVE